MFLKAVELLQRMIVNKNRIQKDWDNEGKNGASRPQRRCFYAGASFGIGGGAADFFS